MAPVDNDSSTLPGLYIQKADDNTGPYGLLSDFFGWGSDKNHAFGPRDPYTVQMQNHPAVSELRDDLSVTLNALCCNETQPAQVCGSIRSSIADPRDLVQGNCSQSLQTLQSRFQFRIVNDRIDQIITRVYRLGSEWLPCTKSC